MRRLRFLILFCILLFVLQLPLLIPWVDQRVIQPLTAGIAGAAGIVLNAIGQRVQVSGTVVSGGCFAVDLKNGCNGVEAALFLVAAVLAFPARARERAIAAVAGLSMLQIANLLRIASLYMLGCYRRNWFDAFHLAVWQSIIFALAVGIFTIWTRRVSAAHAS